jgi:hypothetical protein
MLQFLFEKLQVNGTLLHKTTSLENYIEQTEKLMFSIEGNYFVYQTSRNNPKTYIYEYIKPFANSLDCHYVFNIKYSYII